MNKFNSKKVELMYRSSKLNEQRVNIMRTNSPLPNVNDNEGKESIIRYLPPINLNEVSLKNFFYGNKTVLKSQF